MNKTAIKNFSVWARTKLINDIKYKAGLIGITEKGIKEPLPQSANNIEFYDIGTKEPYSISGIAVNQRRSLVKKIKEKENDSDYETAYNFIMEEVAYTWFNRLIAVRFMEINDYLPSRIRVLSSESGKLEPDLVSSPFQSDIEFTDDDKYTIMHLKDENKIDELFQILFIKQCNALNDILPKLFEKTNDYTELLLKLSIADKENSVVYHLVNDIEENDWIDDENDEFQNSIHIIGWLYQFYNAERRNEVVNIYKGNVKKEDIPSATQLFTTDWIVKYMVDNSLGRYWIERNPNSNLKNELKYFVTPKNGDIKYIDEKINPEEITFFDPCMGSGHILVYAFDVLMKIYRECGYNDRDAVQSIIDNNLFGLDIDERAYHLAYFSIMMKARKYDRRFLTRKKSPKVYPIYEYTNINRTDNEEVNYLISEFEKTKQYGSLVNIRKDFDINVVKEYVDNTRGQITLGTFDIDSLLDVINVTELLLNKYSVVCTNPPYLNKYNAELKDYINKHYKDYNGDLFSVFMYKNFDFCKPNGYCAFMTPFVWMFIKTYEKLRNFIIKHKSISTLVQMEYSAFEEATVPICSFVLKNGEENSEGLYFRLSDFKGGMEVQREKVEYAIENKNCGYFYETKQENFSKIPGSPIAYWVSDNFIMIFQKGKKLGDIADSKQGLATADNNRFLRQWHEVDNRRIKFDAQNIDEAKDSDKKWFPYNKGGEFRKWYGNNDYVVNWKNDGYEIKHFFDDKGKLRSRPQNLNYMFKNSVSWSDITSSINAFRYKPFGHLFDISGMSFFPKRNMKYLLALCNTKLIANVLKIIAPTIHCQCGDVANIPVIEKETELITVENIANKNIIISKLDWDSFETSWDFEKHPLVAQINKSISKSINKPVLISDCFKNWENQCNERFNQLKSNEEELNRIFIEIYGLQDELTPDVEDKDVTVRKADLQRDIKSLLSYAVGCMFGRYSIDCDGLAYAGGEWDNSKYSSFIPKHDNIIPITDEEYIENDIVTLLCEWLKSVFGEETLDKNIEFIANALGNSGKTPLEIIRNYFIKDFFKEHCKIYQKRPIYWLFDSGKQNGFKALIYIHRYNADTIGNVRIDYLHRIQRVYESEINRMQENIENGTNSRQIALDTKRKEKLIKQLKECRDYDENISHLALSRIELDLDDGVKVNYEKLQTASDGKFYNVLAKI